MLNFSPLGYIELLLNLLNPIEVGGGSSYFPPHISFSCVEISLHVEFHPPGLPRSGSFMVGDKNKKTKQDKKIN